ncbi:mitochondrial carrier [Macrolepiota fuliginosa MF-IS2]|uniref:Mitochondrial carrier n=1 Tax=Macrolepiota fuliginosa MF-IS2 TaxID=1400762 RepID=A0A9P6C3H9_9AGAR|nr:mitochondrial carrier [Macrolepiota fuliginosa MF-IS2]
MSAKEASKEIIYGSVAGMVAGMFGYPFDLAKVRLQAQLLYSIQGCSTPSFNGPLDCLNQTWREEGLRGLYRGVSVPITGTMVQAAGLFLAYSSFQNIIQNYYHGSVRYEGSKKLQLTIPQLGVAAGGAGFVTSFILTPMELIKCRMQVQMMNIHSKAARYQLQPSRPTLPTTKLFTCTSRITTPNPTSQFIAHKSSVQNLSTARALPLPGHTLPLPDSYSRIPNAPGSLSIVRSVLHDHGLKGFWLGQTGTIFRETGGCAVWFVVKEAVVNTLQKRRHRDGLQLEGTIGDRDLYPSHVAEPMTSILPWESAIAGAAAGATGTLLFYPADTVKSAIQTEGELRKAQTAVSSTFWRTAFKVHRMHGLKGFYAGCGMTVARSVPSSGIIFVVYDGLRQWFE